MRKMMPQGVGSFCPPGKPTSGHFFCSFVCFVIFRPSLRFPTVTSLLMDQLMCHGGSHPATISELVDASSVYNLGSVDSSSQGPDHGNEDLDPSPQTPNSGGISCQSSHSLAHPISLSRTKVRGIRGCLLLSCISKVID